MKTGKRRMELPVSMILLAVFFLLWEAAARLYWKGSFLFPPFSETFANTLAMLKSGHLAGHAGVSFLRALAGLAAGTTAGLPAGFLLAAAGGKTGIYLKSLWGVLSQVNPFLLCHVMLYFFGLGEISKIGILAWGCVWPVVFTTAGCIENIDRVLLKMGRTFGGGKLRLLLKIYLPASTPGILSGIRIGAAYSLLMIIAAEILGSRSGLGWLLMNEQYYFRVKNMYSIVLVTACLGVFFDAVLALIGKIIVPYELEGYINSSEN
jgi:NitT/TauT family transport system permease protein